MVAQIKELDETFLIKQFLEFLLFYIANKKNQQKMDQENSNMLYIIFNFSYISGFPHKNEQEFQRDFCLSFITLGSRNIAYFEVFIFSFYCVDPVVH